MAKFRKNHNQPHDAGGSGMTTKVGIFVGLVYLLYQAFLFFTAPSPDATYPEERGAEVQDVSLDVLVPDGKKNQIVKHKYYTLNYNENYEIADWIVHEISRDRLNANRVDRTDDFRSDKKVKSGSAEIWDYKRSGYDRGHMVPAGDMGFSREAMSETFFMSNMTPQVHTFNTGIWRELEENIRDWARKFRHVYVATGPVLTKEPIDYIGDNDVAVPHSFFKVILDLSEPELKGIGFVMPNKVSYEPISHYAMSIDEVEKITGIDFFPDLMEDDLEKELEANYNMEQWNVSKRRYELRKKSWNKDRR